MKPASHVQRQYVYLQYVNSRGLSSLAGFTLMELLVTMAVASILAAVAVPAFNNFVQNDRDIGQLNSLVSSLNYARSEAVKRDSSVTVCPSTDGATCSGGSNWAGGWVVVDSNPADPPLQTVPALAGSNTLTPTGSTSGVTFQSSGLVTPTVLTTFTICDARGAAYAREIEVNSTGRVAASQTPGQTVSGAALACPP
jgi:type IV fimbrial biogenesis protein FimT